ncbi:SsgA family sporulation/cell division regulator [Streptomyces sp. NPDC051684]|uniref:SsgA family sporulation/cell division regulator n=1 Tax=Streptomyces sp. NPDC051684 TaxID=3365670 RepID=UPI0037882A8F
MNITLELSTSAVLVTMDGQLPVPVNLRYTSSDPLAVHFDFPARVTTDGEDSTWTFARTLLTEGLAGPAGVGCVRVAPRGSSYTVVELHSELGVAMLRFDTKVLHRFLSRTHRVVALGAETVAPELDRGLAAVYGGRA